MEHISKRELIPHLFRTEHSKIVAVLCKFFGTDHIQAAEDVVSETFVQALETWPYKGVPENPTAWLYTVAKNKAKNQLIRKANFSGKIAGHLKAEAGDHEELEVDLSEQNITDSRLQMLFAICHPSIPVEAQIGLALRILCGFGIDEIADAFLSNRETITKRLMRAKEKLRSEKIEIRLPGTDEINQRLDRVLLTIYLLFNEGYYSDNEDFCVEAMRLTYMLIENPLTNRPDVDALLALMCFHSSKTNPELVGKGVYYLKEASKGNSLSKYHLEANIAFWHLEPDSKEKWETILALFNHLLSIEYSPTAAVNRTYAFSRVYGKEEALKQAEKLRLDNQYYYSLLGELYTGINDEQALINYRKALEMARTASDKKLLERKITLLEAKAV
jgi:RNA polymerase sigma-70 factor (ECF subfamily)